ncbi:MAG: 2-amino-4-hydroxy-6-hydroxymethyldihydropteridine diphosphokinase [Candidatus Margulisiibacteriota bacterium]
MAKKKAAKKKAAKKRAVKKKVKRVVRKAAKKSKGAPKRPGSKRIFLGLGSNVGDREEYIEQAIFLLGKVKGLKVIKRSTNYECPPEGGVKQQPPFINAAIEIATPFSPEKLLGVCQDIEATLGREKEVEWGPRTIDLDILLFGDLIKSDDDLQLPHPLMHDRMFVLKPLKEIAPNVVHPVLEKTITQLFEDRKAEVGEKYDDELPGFGQIKEGAVDDYEKW